MPGMIRANIRAPGASAKPLPACLMPYLSIQRQRQGTTSRYTPPSMSARMKICLITSVILLAFSADRLKAQACGCGGAPLLGSLGVIAPPPGGWQLDLLYEHNDISGLASGTQSLPPDGRQQLSQSGVVRISYGLRRWLTVSGIMTTIRKRRVVSDDITSAGIGDGIVLVQVNLLPELSYPQRDILMGMGFKAPMGPSGLTHNGIRLSPDMQPTSGAWDLLATLFATSDALQPRPLKVYLAASLRVTGHDPDFGPGDQDYGFGNEAILNLGGSYGFGLNWLASLQLNYRYSTPDRLGEQTQPNTGGSWLFLSPGVNVAVGDKIAIELSGQLPVYHRLNGAIQLTTRYTLSLSLHYAFGNQNAATKPKKK